VYSFEPVPDSLSFEQKQHILGAQGNIWTEYIPTLQHLQYMALPRMAALAEVIWSPKELHDWSSFRSRLPKLFKLYEKKDFNYARSAYQVNITPVFAQNASGMKVALSTELPADAIYYTIDGSEPGIRSLRYETPFDLASSIRVKAVALVKDSAVTKPNEQEVIFHKAAGKHISVRFPARRYLAGGVQGLVDGLRGSLNYNDGIWQGYQSVDFEANIDMGDSVDISVISTGFLENQRMHIFFPVSVEYFVSKDGTSFKGVSKTLEVVKHSTQESTIKDFTGSFENQRVRSIKVIAKNIGICPDWHADKGEEAWLFVDEIVVE
jgi:hexosaminidase